MSISIKQLQIFVATAKTSQVSSAAATCFVTQAAASMALSQLEHLMGVKLFSRVGKRLILNDLGHTLLPKASEILDRVTEFETFSEQNSVTGSLTLAASQTTGSYFLPQILANFSKAYPQIKLACTIDNSSQIIEKILKAEADLGFIESNYHDKRIAQKKLKDDKLVIIAAANHPLARAKQIKIGDLKNYAWILREHGSGTREIFETACKDFFKELDVYIELNESEPIKKIVIATNYLSCLSEASIADELKNGELKILSLPNLNLERTFNMIYLAERYHTPLLAKFIREIERQLS